MQKNNDNYAYVTALTTEAYIPGCMALGRSLIEVKSRYKLLVIIPESKEEDLKCELKKYGFYKAMGDYAQVLVLPDIQIPENHNSEQKYSFWKYSFFKLQAASLYDYEKVILLDCDQMAVKNIDHIFEKPHMTATTCGRCIHPDWLDLSAGLLVIEPSESYYNELISAIEPAANKKYEKGLNAGDQDVFNEVAPYWRDHDELYIEEKYNICWGMIEALCKVENVSVKDFYMIHFPGAEKPWHKPKLYYIWVFISCILKGKFDKIFYKIKVYRKYRKLCCPEK